VAQSRQPAAGRQRVQIKVFDVDTGEERFSSEALTPVTPVAFCIVRACCSCSSNDGIVVDTQQATRD
jgi:hypothetical protein